MYCLINFPHWNREILWRRSYVLSSTLIRPCPGCSSDLCSLVSYHTPFYSFCSPPPPPALSGGFPVSSSKGLCMCLEHLSLSSSASRHLLILFPISAQASYPQISLFWLLWARQNLLQALIAEILPLGLSPLMFYIFYYHNLKHNLYSPLASRWAGILLCLPAIGSPKLRKCLACSRCSITI